MTIDPFYNTNALRRSVLNGTHRRAGTDDPVVDAMTDLARHLEACSTGLRAHVASTLHQAAAVLRDEAAWLIENDNAI